MTEEFPVNFKYKEDEILEILHEYVKNTYKQHYIKKNNVQTLDSIMSMEDGLGFIKGNIIKYTSRQGLKKGSEIDDLLKIMHYAVLLYYFAHHENKEKNENIG